MTNLDAETVGRLRVALANANPDHDIGLSDAVSSQHFRFSVREFVALLDAASRTIEAEAERDENCESAVKAIAKTAAMQVRAEAAEQRVRELEEGLEQIARRTRNHNRTFDEVISDMTWIDDECRRLKAAALLADKEGK